MDLDPQVTSGRGDPDPLTPTEKMSETVLKGRYVLGPELGRGGFAVTYLAADLEVASRQVVVKVLHEYRTKDSWVLKKFRGEMESLARIDHPNVVSVFDFGNCADGKPFLVMQYVRGPRLREIIPRDGLPLAQVAAIVKQIGRALTAAHEVGVCHRDLKPENIIVQSDAPGEEQVKLIDFGLAAIRVPGEEYSSTTVSGTHSYMSPEQFQGKASELSDVYQMGVVAYELVTGITPFRASHPAGIVLQQMEGLKVLPRDLRPELPEAAQELILKALSPDPAKRFERAKDFGDALAAALVSSEDQTAEWVKAAQKAISTRSRIRVKRQRRAGTVLAAVAIAIALAIAAFLLLRGRAPEGYSVAVLPFQNRTGDPQMAYLAEGITESLINDLSRVPTLRVSARGAVTKYDGANVDVRTAGKELGVSRIIDGSVSRHGDELFFDTELIDTRSGVRLWGNAYEAKISSLAEVLQQFSSEVTDELRLKLSAPLKERLKRQYVVGSQAYEQYLKGRFYLNKRTASDFQEAISHFNQAIALDPNYAPAYSGLADTYGLMALFGSTYGGAIPARSLEESRRAAERALQLDGTLAEAYAARAFVQMQADYDWKAAEQDFLRSIELNPNWASAHEFYAFELGALSRFEEALREIQIAERLEPDVVGTKAAHGLILRMARRSDQSLALLEPLARNPLSRGLVSDYIAEDYWAKSMPQQALMAVESIPPLFTPHLRIPLLVAAYARAGQTLEARQLLRSYTVQPEATWWYYLALAYLSLHQTDEAVDALEHAYGQRYEEVIWFGVDPLLDELRGNSRFRRLLVRIHRDANRPA